MITEGHRPTWATIDLESLASNFRAIRQRVGTQIKIMSMVKADAYGHGAVECAVRLAREGTDWFGVALPEEAIQLRAADITQPILCVGGFWDGQAPMCLQERITPVVYRLDMVEALDRSAREKGVTSKVHVKVDTGMGRLGIRWDQLTDFLASLARFPNVEVQGVMTHFAAADDAKCQPLTREQLHRFDECVSLFKQHGHQPEYFHLANSAAIYSSSQTWGNMVRPGGVLYGLWRDVLPITVTSPNLSSVMSLHSRIILLKWVPAGETIGYGCTFEASRRSLIAVLPIGYYDGYMRGFSNRSNVLVRGQYAPVVGRVSMDITLIDVTDVTSVSLDDIVTLLGISEDPNLSVNAEDLARIAGTLSYEVTCGIGKRVRREYK